MRIFTGIICLTMIFTLSCGGKGKNDAAKESKSVPTAETKVAAPPDLSAVTPADKALWLRSSAISPDGSTIAFSYRGNIYLVGSKGGAARPLTTGNAYEFMPVWSPDGKSLAYASSQNGNFDVYIISASGGEPKRLTYHSAGDLPVSFSPDGSKVLFNSVRIDPQANRSFPSRVLPELYQASIDGSGDSLVLDIPAMGARWDKDGAKLYYYDQKGYESPWRKHHTSSIARDIWVFDKKDNRYTKLTSYTGEDREPVLSPDNSFVYYLSEKSGSFNIWRFPLADPQKTEQITSFATHPVRYLSASSAGVLSFSYNGELYTLKPGEKPALLDIRIAAETGNHQLSGAMAGGGITEAVLSPSGKEMAVIYHGEVFVSSLDSGLTRRITNTPEEERWVSFSKDGRKLLYASERNGSWNIYEASIANAKEPYFLFATVLDEKALVDDPTDTYQPSYSPDGKKLAFLRKRTELTVRDLATGKETIVLEGKRNISYVDGDQWYRWSPDSAYLAVKFLDYDRWEDEVGIVPADGKQQVINISDNGFDDSFPKWSPDGSMIYWLSNREGAHVWAQYLNKEAFDKALLSKEEFELLAAPKKPDEKDASKKEKEKTPEIKPVKIALENKEDRLTKLLSEPLDYLLSVLSADGEKLYTLDKAETSYSLRETSLREKKTKVIAQLPRKEKSGGMEESEKLVIPSADGKVIYVLAEGAVTGVDIATGAPKPVAMMLDFSVDREKERDYMFEHVWHTMNEKFYRTDMHGIDWASYREAYRRFLPHITNNFDFAELLSEMLGELNVSHTGSGYRYMPEYGDNTASLGLMYENTQEGVKIIEVLEGSPCDKAESRITAGVVLEKINRQPVSSLTTLTTILNRKAGIPVQLSLFDPKSKTRWDETVKPVILAQEGELLYERWVKRNAKEVETRSNGTLGYVHIRGMDKKSFNRIYGEIMGKYNEKKGIVIDTRFNGGGWTHNDLSILFNGKSYVRWEHRGVSGFGGEPSNQWSKKSILLVSESNYSDAHFFPFAYRTLGLGKIVGMPVPGTSTAVWWPLLIDRSLYFGIPQIGIRDMGGKYLENAQLEPDIMVENTPETYTAGRDLQLEKAVEALMEDVKKPAETIKK